MIAKPGSGRGSRLKSTIATLLVAIAAIAAAGCSQGSSPRTDTAEQTGRAGSGTGTAVRAGAVDAARLANAAAEPGEWFTSGRDSEGTYYSPLTSINGGNVERLGFAWDHALGTRRGLEATPIVVDGVMYFPGNWGRVYALD